jgi:hypothetical protein
MCVSKIHTGFKSNKLKSFQTISPLVPNQREYLNLQSSRKNILDPGSAPDCLWEEVSATHPKTYFALTAHNFLFEKSIKRRKRWKQRK